MTADILLQIGELVGVSAIVSAAVNYILEERKFKKERSEARQEEHLRFSIQNYPRFSEVLSQVVHGVEDSNKMSESVLENTAAAEQFENSLTDLLYFLGSLLIFEKKFRDEQGQIFRLASQSGEILAEFLYRLGKDYLKLTAEQESYLAQTIEDKTLSRFRQTAESDVELGKIRDAIKAKVTVDWPQIRQIEQLFEALSHHLMTEIQSIRIPGYERRPISLSKPDQDYIEAIKRIPTLFFDRESKQYHTRPLRIWVYNHWNHKIMFKEDEVQFLVGGGTGGSPIVLDMFDPDDKDQKKKLELMPGETLVAEWDRKWNNQEIEEGDKYTIIYLPDGGDSKYELTYTH